MASEVLKAEIQPEKVIVKKCTQALHVDMSYCQYLFNYSEDDLEWTIGFFLPSIFLLPPSHLSSVIPLQFFGG